MRQYSTNPSIPSIEAMAHDWHTLWVALFAAMGTLLFGFDTGIVTTTIAQTSWVEYMDHPSNALTGAVVSIYVRT